MSAKPNKRDLLSPDDLGRDEIANLLELTERMRLKGPRDLLKGKTLGLLFQEPSLRTRVSFEVAMIQLGGSTISMSAANDVYAFEALPQSVMDGAAAEHVKDAARTLSRYVDAIGVRAATRSNDWALDRADAIVRSYAEFATVPVINLQSHMHHPCQAIADVYTMQTKARRLEKRRLSVVWTQNPEPQSLGAPQSLVLLAAMLGMDVRVVHPQGFELDPEIVQKAQAHAATAGGSVRVGHDLESGVAEADFVYARSWRSIKCYGDPDREALLKRSLDRWILTPELMARSANAWFMHPLPVRRNVSVADAVLDGERSIVYDQAENRLHTQKALLVTLL